MKTGYPPKPLTVEPQLPVSSLGLKNGDQLIVTASPTSKSTVTTSVANQASTAGRQTPNFSAPALQPRLDPRQEKPSDASVQTREGTLVHRVCVPALSHSHPLRFDLPEPVPSFHSLQRLRNAGSWKLNLLPFWVLLFSVVWANRSSRMTIRACSLRSV